MTDEPETLTIAAAHALTGIDRTQLQRAARRGSIPGAVHTNPANPRRGEWQLPRTGVLEYARNKRRGRRGQKGE